MEQNYYNDENIKKTELEKRRNRPIEEYELIQVYEYIIYDLINIFCFNDDKNKKMINELQQVYFSKCVHSMLTKYYSKYKPIKYKEKKELSLVLFKFAYNAFSLFEDCNYTFSYKSLKPEFGEYDEFSLEKMLEMESKILKDNDFNICSAQLYEDEKLVNKVNNIIKNLYLIQEDLTLLRRSELDNILYRLNFAKIEKTNENKKEMPFIEVIPNKDLTWISILNDMVKYNDTPEHKLQEWVNILNR
jgi:hypothetical protein